MTHAKNGQPMEVTLVRYLDALTNNAFDILEAIWKRAETDPALETALLELNSESILDDAVGLVSPKSDDPPPGVIQFQIASLEDELDRPSPPRPQEVVDEIYTDYRCRVLVVDDEPHILDLLRHILTPEFEVVVARSVEAAQAVFDRQPVDILLTDLCLQGSFFQDQSGIELMQWARERSPRTVSLLMSAYGETNSVIEAINRGHVFYYLPKPFPRSDMPLETLRRASRAFTLERKNRDLLDRLKDMNKELEDKVRQRAGELLKANRDLMHKIAAMEKLAFTDALTGLPNRRAMDHLAERDLLWRNRNPAPLAIGLVDIDHFKNVNTEYEWSGGDRVLTEVSRCLADSLREIDHIGRYGGEEFMLIAPQADRHGAEILAERIRKRVESTPIHYKGQTIHVTVSIGVAVVEKDSKADLDRMKGACEAALKRAKAEGRNRCVVTTLPADETVLMQRARG